MTGAWVEYHWGAVSPSRKSFLRAITGTDLAGIGAATLAAELHAAGQGADYIRTHDPAALSDGLVGLTALSEPAPTHKG